MGDFPFSEKYGSVPKKVMGFLMSFKSFPPCFLRLDLFFGFDSRICMEYFQGLHSGLNLILNKLFVVFSTSLGL